MIKLHARFIGLMALLYLNTHMRYTTCATLLLAVGLVSTGQPTFGQTSNPSRLVGTSTYYQVQDEWQALDSSVYTYSLSNFKQDSHAPTYLFNGLHGRLAVPLSFDASYFFTGLFPEVSSPLFSLGSRWKFDSLINYDYGIEFPEEGEWYLDDWIVRAYSNNLVAQESLHYGNSIFSQSISYNSAGQPITYVSSMDPEGDSLGYIECKWSDNSLLKYTSYGCVPSLHKNYEHIYTLDNSGRPAEELIRSYEGTTDAVTQLDERWTISYDASGFVSRLQRWLPDNGEWVSDWDMHIIMEGVQPIETFTLTRDVDTLSTPTFLGNWDTLNHTQLFYSGTELDSVIKQQSDSYGLLVPFSGEYFTYTEGKINIYDRIYKEDGLFNFNEHINHVYDESGRLSAIYRRVDYPGFSTAYDTLFHYDDYGNVIVKELFSCTSYDQSSTYVATDAVARIHYYYEQIPFAGTGEGNLFVHVFPSPANEILSIELAMTDDPYDETQLLISNMQGKVVYRTTLGSGITFHQVDCSNWISGIYAICVRQNEHNAWQKVMVK